MTHLVEENIEVNLSEFGLGNGFLHDTKTISKKKKKKEVNQTLSKLKMCLNGHQEAEKATHRKGENICKSSDKQLVSKIYKKILTTQP